MLIQKPYTIIVADGLIQWYCLSLPIVVRINDICVLHPCKLKGGWSIALRLKTGETETIYNFGEDEAGTSNCKKVLEALIIEMTTK
jgi:hypothetical protein